MEGGLEAGRWIQTEKRNRSFAAIWALLAAGTAIAGVVMFGVGVSNGAADGGLVMLAIFTPMAIGCGRYALGCSKAGLLVAEDKVTIRNPWRTYEIAAGDVHEFVAGTQPASWLGQPTPGIVLKLRDGSARAVWTLAREGLVWNERGNVDRWVTVAHALNALVKPSGP